MGYGIEYADWRVARMKRAKARARHAIPQASAVKVISKDGNIQYQQPKRPTGRADRPRHMRPTMRSADSQPNPPLEG